MQLQDTYTEWLIYRIRMGDSKALELLTEHWYGKLIRYVTLQIKNKETAKDVVQDTWMVVVKKLHTLKNPARFKVWMYSIAHHKAVDWIRTEQKRRNAIEKINHFENDSLNEPDEKDDALKKMRIEIKKLPHSQQQVLNLFYLENCSIKDIAIIQNVPIGTVKSRLFNAREHLKKLLTEN